MRHIRSREIFTNASITIRVVETVDIQRNEELVGHYVLAQVSPIALVVDDTDGRLAMGLAGNPLAMDELSAALPELGVVSQAD